MNTPAADDYPAIKARMEEIERERANAPAEHAMQNAVENYLAQPEEAESKIYMGWDIYAPVNLNN